MHSLLLLLTFLQYQATACSSSAECPRRNEQLYLTDIVEYLLGQLEYAFYSKQYRPCQRVNLRMELEGIPVVRECRYSTIISEAQFQQFACVLRFPVVNYDLSHKYSGATIFPQHSHYTLENVSFNVRVDKTYWGRGSTRQDEFRISAIETDNIPPEQILYFTCKIGNRYQPLSMSVDWRFFINQALRNIDTLSCYC